MHSHVPFAPTAIWDSVAPVSVFAGIHSTIVISSRSPRCPELQCRDPSFHDWPTSLRQQPVHHVRVGGVPWLLPRLPAGTSTPFVTPENHLLVYQPCLTCLLALPWEIDTSFRLMPILIPICHTNEIFNHFIPCAENTFLLESLYLASFLTMSKTSWFCVRISLL